MPTQLPAGHQYPVLAENCHPCRDQPVSPNSPKGLFILSGGFSNGCAFSAGTPFGEGPRFLIRDNDNKFGAAFDRVADGTDIEVLTTPYQAPKANAICERFLGSVRRECLDFFLILSERHLRKTMKQYQAYFNHARPHQGIDQRIPWPSEQPQQQNMGKIISHPILGGLHHDYRRRTPGGPPLPRAA